MMAHTPGPWWVDGPGEGIEVHDTFGRTASVWGEHAPESEAWANARLIAAAPDLLAALIQMRDAFNSYADCPSKCDAVSMAFQAIEKAGGE